jgi:hypothetical protein
MMTKTKSRPFHSMKVNAYAAKAAMRIGMIVAGTVTTKLLMNALPMLTPEALSPRTWRSCSTSTG